MTARNRLRKRAAQKAKVPNFGIKNSKPDIIPQNASTKNPPDDRNNHSSKSTVLTSKPISSEISESFQRCSKNVLKQLFGH